MNRGLTLLVSLIVVVTGAYGQEFHEVRILNSGRSVLSCGEQFAGTVRGTELLTGNSNDVDLSNDTIYLCGNDQVLVRHEGDFVFDPDVAQPAPGIIYPFYECPPFVEGDLYAQVSGDGCLVRNPAPSIGDFWIARGTADGNLTVFNDGSIRNQFFGGDQGVLWFAPMTIDNFTDLDNIPGTQCTKVTTSQAFAVAYLNPIQTVNVNTISGQLTGTFTVQGGYPEFDPSATYDIVMVNIENPTAIGSILSTDVGHGDLVNFSVPEAGVYEITIIDGKGCPYSQIVSIPHNDPVNFCIGDYSVGAGDQICVPITVNGFVDVLTFSFSIQWDPTVLLYDDLFIQSNDSLADVSFNLERQGEASFLYFDLSSFDTRTLPDGDTIFSICFRAVGDLGTSTPILFTESLAPLEVTNENDPLPFNFKPGTISIVEPSNLGVQWKACSDGPGTYEILVQPFGGTGPYLIQILDAGFNVIFSETVADNLNPFVISNFPGGSYTLLIEDQTGGSTDDPNFNLIGEELTILTSATDTIACATVGSGVVRIDSIFGGFGPAPKDEDDYNIEWVLPDGSKQFTVDTLSDLLPGNYQAIVRDLTPGCVDTVSFDIVSSNIDVNLSSIQPNCQMAVGDGSIRAELTTTGNSNITYSLFDADDNLLDEVISTDLHEFTNLNPGSYTVEVNNNICEPLRQSVNLFATKELALTIDTISSVQCFGEANGLIELSFSTSVGTESAPYDVNWSQNAEEGIVLLDQMARFLSLSQLSGGTYDISVIDAVGCTIDTTIELVEPDTLILTGRVVNPPECPDGQFADFTLGFDQDGFGGTPFTTGLPYQYTWFDGANTPNNLIPVDSVVTVVGVDANGCSDTLELGPFFAGPNIDIDQTAGLTCIGDSTAGLRVFSQFQEIDTLDILWSTGETTLEISDLSAGIYAVAVTENEVCTVVDTFEIRDPDFGVQTINQFAFIAQSTCLEPDSGILINFTSNYRGPIDFIWSGPVETITQGAFLPIDQSGVYQYALRDRITECIVHMDSVVVNFPSQLMLDTTITSVSCNGDTDGSIDVSLFQDSMSFYDYSLFDDSGNLVSSTTASSFQSTDLAPGDYTLNFVSVDDSTCADDIVLRISEPEVLTVSVDSFNTRNPRCNGEMNGQITLNWEGGNQSTTPQINWSPDITDSLIATGLAPGMYMISLTDGRGCTDQVDVELFDPEPLGYSIPIPMEPSCNGFETTITVDTAFGGTGPNYSFSVNNGTNQLIGGEVSVFAGSHLITVFDALGCADTQRVEIGEPEAIDIQLPPVDSISLGDSSVLVPNVIGPFPIDIYTWSTNSQAICENCPPVVAVSPIDDQVFKLTVTDAQGCIAESEILVLVDQAKRIYIPNAFSPNGDGLNDFFELFPSNGVASINNMQIFDRWGGLVYQQENLPVNTLGVNTWDGMFGAAADPAVPGVYVYVVQVTFKDEKVLTFRGDVTLIR